MAKLAQKDELVLFIGAGVSFGAGLPLWGSLLWQLEKEVGFTPEEQKSLEKLSFLDRAAVVQGRVGKECFQKLVAEKLKR